MSTNQHSTSGNRLAGDRRKRAINADVAALIAAGTAGVGSFGVVLSGIWMIHLAIN